MYDTLAGKRRTQSQSKKSKTNIEAHFPRKLKVLIPVFHAKQHSPREIYITVCIFSTPSKLTLQTSVKICETECVFFN